MKIFWSWQSDTPGKIGRHLIRDALNDAIARLKQTQDIEEPIRDELHLDHDIEGTTGCPDLARTILDKIDHSNVVVADVTLADRGKNLINSNVALELGYAFRAVTDSNVLLVFNKHYGSHEDLPFDLRHKGGAVVLELAPDADRKSIDGAKKMACRAVCWGAQAIAATDAKKELSLRANLRCRLNGRDGDDKRYMLTVGVENDGTLDATDCRLDLDVPVEFLDQSGGHRLQVQSTIPGYARFRITNKDPAWGMDHLYPGDLTKNDLIFLLLGVRREIEHNHPELLQHKVTATVFSGNMTPRKTVMTIAELTEMGV